MSTKLSTNEKKVVSRKDMVKNIAIIFLGIMLILTFFSNTIMNYSLPEVATDTVQSGSITAKTRGTGTIASDDPYQVSIQESRVISSVAVKQGDVVEKDQVLFYLEDKESTELETAKKELDDMILAYTTELLKGQVSNQSYDNIQSGNVSSTGSYQARIEAAKQKVDAAQARIDGNQSTVTSLNTQIASASVENTSKIDKQGQLAQATANKNAAQEQMTAAKAASDEASAAVALYTEQLAAWETYYMNAVDGYALAIKGLDDLLKEGSPPVFKYFPDMDSNDVEDPATEVFADYSAYQPGSSLAAYKALLETFESQLILAKKKPNPAQPTQPLPEPSAEELNKAIGYVDNIRAVLDPAVAAESALPAATSDYTAKYAAYQAAHQRYSECVNQETSLTNEINNMTTSSTKTKAELEQQKIAAEAALEQAKLEHTKATAELDQLLLDISTELNLGNQSDAIAAKREEIARLQEKAEGAAVKAPVAGTVISVNITAGETTQADTALATLQPEGKGYTMSFSVTNDQAKTVKVGEQAEIQNSWYYSEVEAVLTAIRPDTADPGQKKLLQFSVTGDVQPGQSLSLTVGQKTAEYDMLVPNNAIREDNNGKFILVVETKDSPLGNRYIATRTDVEVLGSDDTKTAISAALYGYEYVITTSTKPVTAGQQVRLTENQ